MGFGNVLINKHVNNNFNFMKIIYIIIHLFLTSSFTLAQISIGKSSISSDSVLLEFGDSENRGLGLPSINSLNNNIIPSEGTMIFDLSDLKVKFYNNNSWIDLSVLSGIQNSIPQIIENESAQIILDSEDSNAQGVLILESSNKALVLPKVILPHKNIINPSPGIIVYDPLADILAVFNGEKWSYWK